MRAVKRARIQAIVMVPVLIGILVGYGYRDQLFGPAYETPVQIATTVVLIVLGWQIARDVGRALGPTLFRRLDPGTAGTVGFLIRLVFVGLAIIVALRVAGLDPRTLAVGGAFTAVIRGQVVADIFRRRRRPTTHDVLKPDIRLSSKTRWLTATT